MREGEICEEDCWCGDRLTAKAGGGESLAHTRWSGGIGYLTRGKWISLRREVCEWKGVREATGASSMLQAKDGGGESLTHNGEWDI